MVRESILKTAKYVLERRRDLFRKLAEEHKYLKK